jgi:uncharacterized protein YceK
VCVCVYEQGIGCFLNMLQVCKDKVATSLRAAGLFCLRVQRCDVPPCRRLCVFVQVVCMCSSVWLHTKSHRHTHTLTHSHRRTLTQAHTHPLSHTHTLNTLPCSLVLSTSFPPPPSHAGAADVVAAAASNAKATPLMQQWGRMVLEMLS